MTIRETTFRETSFREKTIRESNHPGNDRIPFRITLLTKFFAVNKYSSLKYKYEYKNKYQVLQLYYVQQKIELSPLHPCSYTCYFPEWLFCDCGLSSWLRIRSLRTATFRSSVRVHVTCQQKVLVSRNFCCIIYLIYRVGQIKWHHFTIFACNKLMHKRNFIIFGTNKLHKATNGMLPILC